MDNQGLKSGNCVQRILKINFKEFLNQTKPTGLQNPFDFYKGPYLKRHMCVLHLKISPNPFPKLKSINDVVSNLQSIEATDVNDRGFSGENS